jgi:LPS-assembly protein
MVLRRGNNNRFPPRAILACVLAGFLVLSAGVLPAEAALLPAGFFDMVVSPGQGAAAVEADRLSYDGQHDVISAEGGVILSYQGFVIRADRLDFNQQTGVLHATGNVSITDPQGDVFQMDSVEVTGGMKEAFINSLTVTTAKGAVITARDVHFTDALQTMLTDAAYSPCGLCIDSKGRKIGWKVKAARIIYDRESASVTLEQPSLELLGIPVAWLPWFWIPDPTQPRASGLRMPSVDYDEERGGILTIPYFVPVGEDVDLILSPTLMSRQGFLMRGDLNWRFPGLGEIDIRASGLYQLDPAAFATANVPAATWRGAIQTAGRFTPVEDWTAGWSYSVFSDNAYLKDYELTDSDSSINQVYATYLNGPTWLDARVQRFNRLGDHSATDDAKQAMAAPKVTFDHVQDLAPGWGRLHLSGEALGIHREADQSITYNGVPYDFGYEGNKAHLMLEGAWENQWILPGGVVATPFLGTRLDGAWYDGASSDVDAPPASMLLSATPIAAMDVRWPLFARNGSDTHLLEPIAQLVYRGSSTTEVGITNDDAQSFVFDTSNLFSYNRFSGIDRQETGLRANIGGHYLGSFADGSWLDLVAGESFHLLGTNAFGVSDQVLAGIDSGLGGTASYIVASARGGFANGLSAGGKIQVDPATPRVTRAGVGVAYANAYRFSAGADYIYIAADAALGTVLDQHEIAGRVGVPVDDYWTVAGGLTYNIATNNWIKANTGVTYDDGYLLFGGNANLTPTSWGFGISFKLKGPDGEVAF